MHGLRSLSGGETGPAAVAKELRQYARRGVFRSFSRTAAAEYRFRWLWNLPFRVGFDTARGALWFRRLLPAIEAGSALEAELKAFVRNCCSPARPEHRRVDPKRVSIRYTNRRGQVSLVFVMLGGHYSYGARKAIHLVNEIFLEFLHARYPEYLAANFGLPEE